MNLNKNPPQSNEQDSCPTCLIPLTHRRLKQAHLLWHQTLAAYHDAEAFRANLNATIEALRNVTFVLQNEKHAFPHFDTWYGAWQKKLKTDSTSKWLQDARVKIVHQGDLESYSYAEVRLVTYQQEILSSLPIPIHTPSRFILQNSSIRKLLDPSTGSDCERTDGSIAIERRWSTQELDGKEILSAVAHVYGLVADLVLDAHIQLGNLDCIPSESSHPDFPSSSDRSGSLRCMLATAEERTERFNRSGNEQMYPTMEKVAHPYDFQEVIDRYGLEITQTGSEVLNSDPLEFAHRIQHIAKRVIRRDKNHHWMIFLRDGKGCWQSHSMFAKDRTEKQLLMQMVAKFVEARGCDALIEVGEMWMALVDPTSPPKAQDVENIPGRGEVLAVMITTREGLVRQYVTPIKRGRFGGLKLEDTQEVEDLMPYYLQPVFEVWRKQRMFRTPDGGQSLVWMPDVLDLCPCGGEKRFGECCKAALVDFDHKTAGARLAQSLTEGDSAQAEAVARTHLAQYVIWVRQHTAAAIHTGEEFFEKMVQIDALALESLTDNMITALTFAGKTDLILPQLRRLRKLVEVPRLAMRLTAIASQWLFVSKQAEEAVLELDVLGDPGKLTDSLALSLIAGNFDLTRQQRTGLLARAIDVAACDEEKLLARLNMASYLSSQGQMAQALSQIQTVIHETDNDPSSAERSNAFILRWKVSNDELDFPSAFEEMKKVNQAEHRIRNGIYLIDHSKYAEAEDLLAPLVNTGDVTSKLLIVDARLRIGEKSKAREMFDTIKDKDVDPTLRYPYAHTMSLLVWAGGFVDLQNHAVALMSSLTAAGGEQDEQVRTMLGLLKAM